ncbi:hypothetical protein ASZ90_006768 [hydrocarbon metagenome]|uniref:Uncharacterized protein n=1 Tax=hydrocarbon metagenome TaxID=938273 RepID=A0A0W8FRH5_9ZZZZ
MFFASFYKVLVCLTIYAAKIQVNYTNSLSLANFVGSVVGFLNVLIIRLRSLLLAAALSFEIEMVLVITNCPVLLVYNFRLIIISI